MGNQITIAKLIENHTMSADMAGLLWAAVSEKVSFLTAAVYRNAGKSTVAKAVLSLRSKNVSLHYASDNPEVTEKLLNVEKHGGYLVVDEFSAYDYPGYLWGDELRHVFKMLKIGYSLQASIHAENAQDAILELTEKNQISDEDASQIQLVIFIEMFGTTLADAKRRVTQIYEVHRVDEGKPLGHLIFKWDKESDNFEMVEESHLFGRNKEDVRKRSEILGYLANTDKTSQEDIEKALADFSKE
ncbi:MAG: hypothetical protein Q8M88_16020 [Phenylobacterium sp.]|uniref:hypothetical protein n=1 Tax=Phenylobacterium sp. TaxID=1871053 RepID=UPI0027349239|nr:hypothetical protein [Phenylobacterium sp.]MDP3175937.1 hypothetical protein [Phenylobacterium sp.]